MKTEKMFAGLNKEEWGEALKDQNEYLQKEYGYSIDAEAVDAAVMNENAEEAAQFMAFMARSLKDGLSAQDETVLSAIQKHIACLRRTMEIDAAGFAAQSRFFLTDDFHRSMLEGQQTGLNYYLCIAADHLAARETE